jgi:hypothetical protein
MKGKFGWFVFRFIIIYLLNYHCGDSVIGVRIVENVENSLLLSDHLQITKDRIVVDNAISVKQLKVLIDFVYHRAPILDPDATTKGYSGENAKYNYKDMGGVVSQKFSEAIPRLRNIPSEGQSKSHHLKEFLFWKEMVAIELQIIDYAESFFRVRLSKKSSAIFVRKRIKLDTPDENSPAEVNNAEGWLVSSHVDSCPFNSGSWSCNPHRDAAEKEEMTTRHVSVVLFLNELSDEEAGGELVFMDPLHSTVMSPLHNHNNNNNNRKHSTRGHATLSNSTSSTSTHNSTTTTSYDKNKNKSSSANIEPPSRDSIRRALRHEKQRIQESRKLQANTVNGSLVPLENYVKAIHVAEKQMNYTVVLPKIRRLAMFNSSAANVHAVTNLLHEADRRLTYFMFLTITK